MKKYMFILFVLALSVGLLPSSLATEGAEEDKQEVVYLWRDSFIGQTVKVPYSFIAINRPLSADLPKYYLKPPFLNGQKCSHTADQKFFDRVEKILAPNIPFTIKKIFFTMSKKNLRAYLTIKWLFRFLSFMEWHKFRGGIGFYYLIQDKQGEDYIIDDKDITAPLLDRHLSQPAKKAQAIIDNFQQNQTGFEKGSALEAFPSYKVDVQHENSNKTSKMRGSRHISITWEGYAEYIDKCQYYQSPQDLAKAQETEIKEQQKSYSRILELIQKAPPGHLFKNELNKTCFVQGSAFGLFPKSKVDKNRENSNKIICGKGNTLDLQVNEKALALLLLNSSFLRIKDIKVKNPTGSGQVLPSVQGSALEVFSSHNKALEHESSKQNQYK